MTDNLAILDDITSIKNIDKGQALSSIELLPNQCEQAWREAHETNLPEALGDVDNIVIAGMGGSSYGARIIKSLYSASAFTQIPIELANGYNLPGYVSNRSLVILSSYSGTTEETLVCAKEAVEKKSQIMGLTSGGPLAAFLKQGNYPSYIFTPQFNPSKQPRLGGGYMIIGLIALLTKLGKVSVGGGEIASLVIYLTKCAASINEKIPSQTNNLKKLAYKLKSKIPIVIVADFLDGAAYSVRNPFHETAKQFGLYFTIPELNHHLLEGLSFPRDNRKLLHFLFIQSALYDDRNKKRLELTKKIVTKNNIPEDTIVLDGSSNLIQTMELIQIGAYLTFYIAMLHGVDPSQIPWVDYFKKEMQ